MKSDNHALAVAIAFSLSIIGFFMERADHAAMFFGLSFGGFVWIVLRVIREERRRQRLRNGAIWIDEEMRRLNREQRERMKKREEEKSNAR